LENTSPLPIAATVAVEMIVVTEHPSAWPLGHIELPAHLSSGGFDHADIHSPTDRIYVAHTANDSIDTSSRSFRRITFKRSHHHLKLHMQRIWFGLKKGRTCADLAQFSSTNTSSAGFGDPPGAGGWETDCAPA
jgi:hypothetical protein